MADKKHKPTGSRFAAKLSNMQSEIAIGVALVLAAGGFSLAQLDVDLPFQWCPTGTVDRVECFRGWLLPTAGWIAAIFAYLTIRQVRKQVDNLEAEIEKNSASERRASLRSFKNEMFNFHGLEKQLFEELSQVIIFFDQNGTLQTGVSIRIASLIQQLNGYDWSRLRYLDTMTKTSAQIDLLRSVFEKIGTSSDDDKTFVENARHYVFVRDIFYEIMEKETGIDFTKQ